MQSAPTSLGSLLAGIPTQNATSTESFAAVTETNGSEDFSAVMDDVSGSADTFDQPETRCASCGPESNPTHEANEPQSAVDGQVKNTEAANTTTDETGDFEVAVNTTPEAEEVSEVPPELVIDPATILPTVTLEAQDTHVATALPNLDQQGLSEIAAIESVAAPTVVEVAVGLEASGVARANEESVGIVHRTAGDSDEAASESGFESPAEIVSSNDRVEGTDNQGFDSPTAVDSETQQLTRNPITEVEENSNPEGRTVDRSSDDIRPFDRPSDLRSGSGSVANENRPLRNTSGNSGGRETVDRLNPFANGQRQSRTVVSEVSQVEQPATVVPEQVQSSATEVTTELQSQPDPSSVASLSANTTPQSRRPNVAAEGGEPAADIEGVESEIANTLAAETEQRVEQQQLLDSEVEVQPDKAGESQNVVEDHLTIKTNGAIASLFAGAGIAAASAESEADEFAVAPAGITDVSNAYGVAGMINSPADTTTDAVSETEAVETVAFETLAEDAYESILDRIEVLRDGETEEIELQIDPPELGRLNIRIARTADEVSARITVVDPGTLEMLQGELTQLRDMLDEAGVSFSSFELEQQSTGQQQHADSERRDSDQHSSPGFRGSNSTNTKQPQSQSVRRDNQAIDILA